MLSSIVPALEPGEHLKHQSVMHIYQQFIAPYFYCTIILLDAYGGLPVEGRTCVCCLTYIIVVN